MRALIVVLSIFAPITLARAQSPVAQTPSPAFEVASVKPNKSGDSQLLGLGFRPGGDVFAATNVTVRDLLRTAYSRRAFDVRQFAGAPG